MFEMTKISSFLFKWQSLAGAFIGAFIPIVFSLVLYLYKSKKDFKMGMGQLEKFLVYSINKLYDIRHELDLFIIKLDSLIDELEKTDGSTYFLGTTNFPLLVMEHNINDINKSTRSLYLSNKLMKCFSMLKDVNLSISDLREEFRLIISRNHDVILSYKDKSQGIGISPITQTQIYLDHLKAMRNIIKKTILDKNIPETVRSFLGARFILLKYMKLFGFMERIKYEGFLGGISKKNNGQFLVEDKFKKEIKIEFQKFEKLYKEKMGA